MYGILAIHEVCIQLDCVGMARMPYPPTKKLLQMFCRSFFLTSSLRHPKIFIK